LSAVVTKEARTVQSRDAFLNEMKEKKNTENLTTYFLISEKIK
jgi:hypothetical protein